MTNGERYEELHPGCDWDVYDLNSDCDEIVLTKFEEHGEIYGDSFDPMWWFREESEDKWTVAQDELIISHEFSMDELMRFFIYRTCSEITHRKNLLEKYGLKGVRMLCQKRI